MTGKLIAWRRRHESRFKYDRTPNAQDVADERALRGRFAAEKSKLESIIRNGLGTMRNARALLDTMPDKARRDRALLQALEARAKAEQDLKLLGESVPTSTVTLSVTQLPMPAAQPTRPTGGAARSSPHATNVTGTPDCPNCGKPMVRRRARKGRNAGGQFWGCTGYPHCKGTRNF